jgi:hypothetical protein
LWRDESAPGKAKAVASYVHGVEVRYRHPVCVLGAVASVALLGVMFGCGSDAPEQRSPPPSANRLLDADVAARLIAVARPARRATVPLRVDMRRIARFSWTRMFVYADPADETDTPSAIRADLAQHGVTTAGPGILATKRPLIVFTNGRRVARVAHSSAIDFQCLEVEKPLRRTDPLVQITRSKGARENPRYPLVAAPVPYPKPDKNPCLDSFGILT